MSASEVLGISNVSLYKMIEKDKSLPAVQLGRRKSIPKEQLKEWIGVKSNKRTKSHCVKKSEIFCSNLIPFHNNQHQ